MCIKLLAMIAMLQVARAAVAEPSEPFPPAPPGEPEAAIARANHAAALTEAGLAGPNLWPRFERLAARLDGLLRFEYALEQFEYWPDDPSDAGVWPLTFGLLTSPDADRDERWAAEWQREQVVLDVLVRRGFLAQAEALSVDAKAEAKGVAASGTGCFVRPVSFGAARKGPPPGTLRAGRSLARALHDLALRDLERGDASAALAHSDRMLHVVRALSWEGTLVGLLSATPAFVDREHLVRQIAASGRLDEAALTALARALEEPLRMAPLWAPLESERATLRWQVWASRLSDDELRTALGPAADRAIQARTMMEDFSRRLGAAMKAVRDRLKTAPDAAPDDPPAPIEEPAVGDPAAMDPVDEPALPVPADADLAAGEDAEAGAPGGERAAPAPPKFTREELDQAVAAIDAVHARIIAASRVAPFQRPVPAPPAPKEDEPDGLFSLKLSPSVAAFALERALGTLDLIPLHRAGTRVVVAVERFRLRHGHLPTVLTELVPEFLASVPVDPFDGQPLRYRRLSAGAAEVYGRPYVIYAVGRDRRDDGGRLARWPTDAISAVGDGLDADLNAPLLWVPPDDMANRREAWRRPE